MVRLAQCAFSLSLPSLALLAGVAAGQTELHHLQGTAQYDFLGWSVDGAGDVDGDGNDDVVVGLLGYSAGGRAIVFSGQSGAVLHELDAIDFSDASGARDVDGDGFADLVVGDVGDAK